ncbi:uncharacterized protein LOC123192193 isoform X5 [Mangifera indica]|uniref:uncharacterized protein LOC123192193 isoform X5 n=1 Tax=Mangifera indica TaxID=29780 RepID=UPI001CF979CE|nr:uncharacterized protein LOC123192193 isoform X5 [Mangifera indica]
MLQALCKSFQNMQLNFSPFRYRSEEGKGCGYKIWSSQFIISFYQAAKGDSLMPRTTTCASWDHNSPVLMSKPTNNRIVICFMGNHLNCDKNLPHPVNLGIMIQGV